MEKWQLRSAKSVLGQHRDSVTVTRSSGGACQSAAGARCSLERRMWVRQGGVAERRYFLTYIRGGSFPLKSPPFPPVDIRLLPNCPKCGHFSASSQRSCTGARQRVGTWPLTWSGVWGGVGVKGKTRVFASNELVRCCAGEAGPSARWQLGAWRTYGFIHSWVKEEGEESLGEQR